ncbi:MAG TPA: hypothetical protein ENK18_00425 [Deltaproteobacteria bacterium]|nr:hypothetical protein [Deltaproteobacteria bacterium]
MARPRYDDPCPCGSGRRYRDCHRREDRSARDQGADERAPAPPSPSTPAPAPASAPALWLRAAPWIVGPIGLGLAGWIAGTRGPQEAFVVFLATGLCVGAFLVFGDPPPPRDDPGDPAGINFGR